MVSGSRQASRVTPKTRGSRRHLKPYAAVDFETISSAALPALPTLVPALLPDGRRVGTEWVALNPRRSDHRVGSFKVNLKTGRWADFATDDRGGDVIALVAFLRDIRQIEAAKIVAQLLGSSQYQSGAWR